MIDLDIDNEIYQNNETKDEIGEFVKELKNSLTKENFTTTLNMEILSEMTLATKYKEQLDDIVNKCMEELSYEYDFLYFDYDKNEKSYFIDGYSEGNITRNKMSDKDLEGTNFEKGTFWEIYDENHVVEADELKDYLKINIESELETLDLENEKKVGKR